MKFKMLIVASLLTGVGLQARYISVKNDIQFLDEINKFEFALVCFVQTPHSGNQDGAKFLRKDIKLLEKTIEAISDADPYRNILKHEIGFIVVDAAKDSVRPLIEKYQIAFDEMPQFLLFKNGKVVSSMSGEFAKLVGFVCKADLLDFIDDYFGKALDDILSKKAEEKQEDKEMQLARYAAYAGSLYPYGGYAPYNANGPYTWYGYSTFYQNRGYWGNQFFLP